MNFKKIHIGTLISHRVTESSIEMPRICNFLKCTEEEITEMYKKQDLTTDVLLKWSKLLKYDFFRIYSQHLILYAPPSASENFSKKQISKLPRFRKNIYTQEIIDFIMEQITSEKMTKKQVLEKYNIPKTTLHKWINKSGVLKN